MPGLMETLNFPTMDEARDGYAACVYMACDGFGIGNRMRNRMVRQAQHSDVPNQITIGSATVRIIFAPLP